MIDRCGRTIDYLRISVTDRCNLRCIYCMPENGVKLVDRSLLLREEEILRICRIMAELGITKIKLTGGEPLLHVRMPELVEQIKAIPGIKKVTLTTNGILLKDQMAKLAGAGLDAVNVSLDTRSRECFQKITRKDSLDQSLEGIKEALRYPEVSVKINCVPLGIQGQDICQVAELAKEHPVHVRFIEMMPIGCALRYPEVSVKINCVPLGIQGQDICQVAELAKEHPVHVRFIEMMPIGCGTEFHGMSEKELTDILEAEFGPLKVYQGEPLGNGPSRYYEAEGFQGKLGFISAMSEKELTDILEAEFGPLKVYQGEPLGNGPSRYYEAEGFQGKLGFISAVSHKFCGECNRIRLTSQGFLKTCLQYTAGRDLREIIRNGGTDEELKDVIREALNEKPDGHHFLEKAKKDDTEKLCMSQIGG